MSEAVIDVHGLRFSYPDGREVLKGLDLHVQRGECVAMLGPNGAGKTTLALHLNGINRPDHGEVRIAGMSVKEPDLIEVRRRVGMVFQDPNDQLFMPSVKEDVAFGPANVGIRGAELDVRVNDALDAVSASDLATRAPHHISGGERRRVAVATVLAMEPDVLVLDEPTSGLDPLGRRELISMLKTLPITMLVITHDLSLALELCERTLIMDDGIVVADGPTQLILADAELLAQHRLELPYGFDASVLIQ